MNRRDAVKFAASGLVLQVGQSSARAADPPAATAHAKIDDAGETLHRMGDVGFFDGEGRLWFCGRKAHRVVTVEGTLFSVPCETIFDRSALQAGRFNPSPPP